MKKKFSLKEVLIPTLALFLISAVCTGILAFTNASTEEKIAENQRQTELEMRMVVCPEAKSFSDEKTVSLDGENYTYVAALDESSNEIGYVFTASSKGYGGTVTVMTGIAKDGNLTGIQTLELNETAGLGMNAKKADYRDQYKDKAGPFVVDKDKTADDNRDEISSLTGATITSRAVTDAVNKTVEIYNSLTGGENNG